MSKSQASNTHKLRDPARVFEAEETGLAAVLAGQIQPNEIQERADLYYSRFYTLLKRIAEAQPAAPIAMLELLERAIEEAQGTVSALETTLQEILNDWDVL
ncbi:hypothetical protein [Acaryochloris sp. IP29b_bin.148]|uniref:hypothetical protein n=1 Tax=Acaryochloris sp. IP29b_bin.148 TaxID=2969218 RepID=UPI0026051E85|nr:hypothetical protein [Acaryochloris sp. IP29b_bin.148]